MQSHMAPSEPSAPLDLDQLLARLREVAAEHADADLAHTPPTQPWAPPLRAQAGRGPAGAAMPQNILQNALMAHAGRTAGLSLQSPYWVVDAEGFVALAYQSVLGRSPDPQGRDHVLGELARHKPRTELVLEMVLSDEARRLRPGLWTQGRWVGHLLRFALNFPVARGQAQWLVRGVLRRTERWLARRAQGSAFGIALAQARVQDAALRQVHDQAQEAESDRAALERQLVALQTAQAALQAQAQSAADQAQAQAQAQAAEAAAVDQFFVAFEAHFRGEAAALRAQLAQDYLHLLHAARAVAGDLPCLDLGCGRGVWLELLRTEGFKAQGVDLNPGPVAQAQAQGLSAEVGDALVWLQAQPANSALAITAFHLMEHLPFALRLALTQECARVLAPGGVLIYETPNPENIWVGTHTFYHDPTHTQPLTPDSLAFLVEYCGLQAQPVLRLHPYPESANVPGDEPVVQRLNGMTCGGQDFAVIAHKPVAATPVQ